MTPVLPSLNAKQRERRYDGGSSEERGIMRPVESLTVLLYAKAGLAELAKPHGDRLDRTDAFCFAYEDAMALLGDRGFDPDDDELDDELALALFIALLAELSSEARPVEAALRSIANYFWPEKAPLERR
jgi:hypothetical protein